MRVTIPQALFLFDTEIDKTAKKNRKLANKKKQEKTTSSHQETEIPNANPPLIRTLGDYAIPTIDGCGSSIVRPLVQANNFELRLSQVLCNWCNRINLKEVL